MRSPAKKLRTGHHRTLPLALASLFTFGVIGCTQGLDSNAPTQKSTVRLTIRGAPRTSPDSLQTAALTDDYCYALMVSGDSPAELNRHRFSTPPSSSCVHRPAHLGTVVGLLRRGDRVELDVPVGPQRRFDLIGFRKVPLQLGRDSAPADCKSLLSVEPRGGDSDSIDLFLDGSQRNLQPRLMATATSAIVPGPNQVTLDPLGDGDGVSIDCQTFSLARSTAQFADAAPLVGSSTLLKLTARDERGEPISTGGWTLQLSLTRGTSGGSFSAPIDHGDGTYTSVFTAQTAGTVSDLKVSANSGADTQTALFAEAIRVQASSTAIEPQTPGPATHLGFSTGPVSTARGSTLPAIVVSALDANDLVDPTFEGPITLAIDASFNPGGGTPSGTLTLDASQGTATFSDLRLNSAGLGYRLRASSGGLTDALSDSFEILGVGVSTSFPFDSGTESSVALVG